MRHSPGFLRLVKGVKRRIRETSIAAVRSRQERRDKTFLLVDVREDHEWEKGRLPGAIHIGKGIIERDIEERVPNKRRELILYCGGGFRSALAADNLQKMGYKKVRSMDGGFRGWKEARLPIER
jgi:rhodanese-related sulfurtransferase